MILDERLEFADNVDVSAAAGTALIGDVIDLGNDGLDGNSDNIFLVIESGDTEIITGGVAGTIQFELASDAAAAIATDGSATTHYLSSTFVTDDTSANDAEMGPNARICAVQLPRGTYERYLGILAIIATTTVTAGTINAFLTREPYAHDLIADGVPAGA